MNDFVPVRSFFSRYDAEQAKGLLDEQNIRSIISADDCGGFRPHLTLGMGNVRLLVHPSDIPQVNEVLRVLDEPIDESPIRQATPTAAALNDTKTYKKLRLIKVLGFVMLGFFLLTVVALSDRPQIRRGYYPNQKIKHESVWRRGKADGLALEYYQTGQVKAVWPYKNDELNGRLKEYYPNGVLKLEQEYKDHQMEGESKSFYESGRLESVGQTKAGNFHGRYTSYYEDGSVWEDLLYKEGRLLDRQGRPVTGREKTYYQNGTLEGFFAFKDGELDGEMKVFYESGRLKTSGTFKNNLPVGAVKEFYENGSLKSSETADGNETAQAKEYDQQGNLIYEYP